MKSKQVFLSPYGDQWKVQTVGTGKVAGIFDNKSDARVRAIELAKNKEAELFIQKQDGTIQERNSYGNDPISSKG